MSMNLVNNEVIFWGASGHARVLAECLTYTNKKLVALFDNNDTCISPLEGIPLYHGKAEFENWLDPLKSYNFQIAIGGCLGQDRIELSDFLIRSGLIPFFIQHPTAFVADTVKLGQGVQVLANATVCTDVIIGRDSIINTAASVDHECKLGNGVHICPGAHLAGCVSVDDLVMVGTGAVILPRLTIGTGAIIGAGAVVTKNVSAYATVVGNPAKITNIKIHDTE